MTSGAGRRFAVATVSWGLGILSRIGGVVFVALLLATPECARAADAALVPAPVRPAWYPELVTSVDVYGQSAKYDTGNLNNAHLYGARAVDVSLGVRFGEHLMVGFRTQEAWTNVSLTLAPQTIDVHSRSYGVHTLLSYGWFDWDTLASVGYNDNSTVIPGFFGGPPSTASWQGREWAVLSTVGAKVPVGFLIVEPRAGARVNLLHDDGYNTGGPFGISVPEQVRSTTTWLGQAKISAPIRLDQAGILTPWIGGEISRTTNPHPPLGVLTDLTGMAGGHYVLNVPEQEGPGPFPAQTWRTASVGLRLDVTPSFTMDASAVWSWNDLGSWMAYQWGAVVRF
jgi:hypothetical protein